jgi:DNA end-binding protein Ku
MTVFDSSPLPPAPAFPGALDLIQLQLEARRQFFGDLQQIAEKIVEQQSGDFDPSEFRDRYEDALRALIEDKRKGKPVKPSQPANDDTKVVDLMAALKKSLESGGDKRERAERFTAAKSKTTKKPGGRRRVA